MIIILEGPKKSGKTTLAWDIARMGAGYKFCILNPQSRHSLPSAELMNGQIVLLDNVIPRQFTRNTIRELEAYTGNIIITTMNPLPAIKGAMTWHLAEIATPQSTT